MDENKPLSVGYVDFMNLIMADIGDSGLPPFLIEVALRDILNDVHSLAQKQYNIDVASYRKGASADRDTLKDIKK